MIMHRNPLKIFYGWWIVVASFLIAVYIGGAVFYGFTAFFEPIVEEMGWSYTQLSIAASLRGLEIGLLSPFIGFLVDRWGPRRIVFGGVLTTVFSLVMLSFTTSLIMFYMAFALLAFGTSACTVTVLLTTIANWFRRRMGIASGIAIAGFGFSGVLVPVIVKLIDIYDWRQTAIILALGMIILILPLSLLFRHKPEQYGYFPDGQNQSITADLTDSPSSKIDEIDLRPKKAIKSATFWRLVLSRMYLLITMMAVITHVMPYLSSIGISRSTSSLVATAIPLTSILGRLSFGWLGDKFSKKTVAATSFIMMSCGLFCFAYTSDVRFWLIIPCIVFLGIGYGGTNAIIPVLAREHFGRIHFGSIYGLMEGFGAMASIIGPIMAGWAFDNWGSYHIVWILLACLASVAVISVSTITPVKTINS
jgi:MFS family permease